MSWQVPSGEELEERIGARVIAQAEAVRAVVDVLLVFLGGLAEPERPAGSMLLLGPTGVGKTWLVEAIGEELFGTRRAAVKVDCGEMQHGHEISKLTGAPPGYIGFRESRPLITETRLREYWNADRPEVSLLLFDEIEKANCTLFSFLLGALDRGELTLGDNTPIDLGKTVIFMTSNLGGREISHSASGDAIGLVPPEMTAGQVEHAAIEAARRHFSPEFFNRIGRVVVFRTLQREDIKRILEIHLAKLAEQAAAAAQVILHVSADARDELISRGSDLRYGARPLKRQIDGEVKTRLARLIAGRKASQGSRVGFYYSPAAGFTAEILEGRVAAD